MLSEITQIVSIFGGIVGLLSAVLSWKHWKKINQHTLVIDDSEVAAKVLPVWYIKRMMTDTWLFGLGLDGGRWVVIEKIERISDDKEWIDVQLAESHQIPEVFLKTNPDVVYAVASDRKMATLNVRSINIAIDLITS